MIMKVKAAIVWPLALVLALPTPTSTFSWPPLHNHNISPTTSTSQHPTILLSSSKIRRGRDINASLKYLPLHSRNSTTTDDDRFHSRLRQQQPSIDIDFFEAGFIAHQSLLNSMNYRQHHLNDHHGHNQVELMSSSSSESSASELNARYEITQSISAPPSATPSTTTKTTTTISTAPTAPSTPKTTRSILPNLSDTWKARILLLLSAALYGTNFTMVKNLDDIMPVGISSTMRFGFAAAVMLPMLLAPLSDELEEVLGEDRIRRREIGTSIGSSVGGSGSSSVDSSNSRDTSMRIENVFQFLEQPSRLSASLAGMEIGLYNSIGYIAQAVGLRTTTASKSAFICSMAVVTVPILDYIWGKQLLRRQIIGACLAAFGVFALELGGQQTTITDGDLMSLIQPLVFGLGFWKMEAAMEKFPTEAGRLAAAQLLTVFLVSLSYLVCWSPMMSGGGDDSLPEVCNVIPSASEIIAWLHDPYIMGMFIWTGIITTAFTIYMETLALKTLSAAETTLIFSTEPLFGAAFAAIVAHEYFGLHDAIGAAFIIAGCLVSGMDVGKLLGGSQKMASPIEATVAEK